MYLLARFMLPLVVLLAACAVGEAQTLNQLIIARGKKFWVRMHYSMVSWFSLHMINIAGCKILYQHQRVRYVSSPSSLIH